MISARFQELRHHTGFLLVLVTISLCLGLMINQFRDNPLPLLYQTKEERLLESVGKLKLVRQGDEAEAAQSTSLSEVLSLEEFKNYVQNNQGIVVDARPEIFYRLGHVPGALSLPRDDFENVYRTLKDKLEANRAQPLVIYCASISCDDAGLVKKALMALGFTQLKLFEGGWAAWKAASNPEEVDP